MDVEDLKKINDALRNVTGRDLKQYNGDQGLDDTRDVKFLLEKAILGEKAIEEQKRDAADHDVGDVAANRPQYDILPRSMCRATPQVQRLIQEWAHNGLNVYAAARAVGLTTCVVRGVNESKKDYEQRYKLNLVKHAYSKMNTTAGRQYQRYLMQEIQRKFAASPDNVIRRIANRAQANLKDYITYTSDGTVEFFDLEKIPREVSARLKKFTVNAKTGNISIELHDAQAADVSLAKIMNLMNKESEEEVKRKKAANTSFGMTVNIAGESVIKVGEERKKGQTGKVPAHQQVVTEEQLYEEMFTPAPEDAPIEDSPEMAVLTKLNRAPAKKQSSALTGEKPPKPKMDKSNIPLQSSSVFNAPPVFLGDKVEKTAPVPVKGLKEFKGKKGSKKKPYNRILR